MNRSPNAIRADIKLSPRIVPLKRRIHQHDYQNLPEDMPPSNRLILIKTASSSSSSLASAQIARTDAINYQPRNKSSSQLSTAVPNAHSPPTKHPQQQQKYRHFGDTNHLRNNRKMAQKRMQQNQQQSQHQAPRPKQNHEQHADVVSSGQHKINGFEPNIIKTAYSTCNIIDGNDIDAIGADANPLLAKSPKTGLTHFVDVKNRIKMFALSDSVSHSPSHSPSHSQSPNGQPRSHSKLSNYKNSQRLHTDYANGNCRKNQRGHLNDSVVCGGSSNLSSSNSNSSDINSLDSMEHETNYRANGAQPNLLMKNVGAQHKNSMIRVDQMPHLGPFDFRQMLRPTLGPTNSLRKRKCYDPMRAAVPM